MSYEILRPEKQI